MSETPDQEMAAEAAARLGLGAVEAVEPWGGTAGRAWRARAGGRLWLVRKRGARTSSDEAVAFDHGLRRWLASRGVPTVAPVQGPDGASFVRIRDAALEAYPFVEGLAFAQAPAGAMANAARQLARLHLAGAEYEAARSAPPVAQYGAIGFPESSSRMEDPALLAAVYGKLLSDPASRAFVEEREAVWAWLMRLNADFGPEVYEGLPATLTHGDYTPANLVFDAEGAVAGVFDFDWARWAPKARDVADGMYFFSAQRRTPLQAGDIWSLTEAAAFDVERCAQWVMAYREAGPLSAKEINALPLAFAARWLSIRAEGMAKVPASERLRFCFREADLPLKWLDANWRRVKDRVFEPWRTPEAPQGGVWKDDGR
ncbi:MAG TPA: phosphotransferase [Candidatus Brocadiia bacterium]|nr:phosphotransferase [Candidatus Brocadiia bacterium]